MASCRWTQTDLLLDVRNLLLVLAGGRAEGEHDLAAGVEPEVVHTGDRQQEHDEDEPIMDDDMF